MFKNESLQKVYEEIQKIKEDKSGFRDLTIIDMNGMAMTSRRIIKVSQVDVSKSYEGECMKVVFKLPRKRKLMQYNVSGRSIHHSLFFAGQRDDIKIDTDFNCFMGNAMINLAVDTKEEAEKLVSENMNKNFSNTYIRLVGKDNSLDIKPFGKRY